MPDPSASKQPAAVGRRDERLETTSGRNAAPRSDATGGDAPPGHDAPPRGDAPRSEAPARLLREDAPSESARTEGALGEAERTRLLARYEEVAALAGGLAHEIRNPLSTIGMLLELMAEDLSAPESPRDRRLSARLQTVQTECRHLEEILNAFLQFARAGELTMVETDLNQLVREFIEFYRPDARQHAMEISPHLASDLPLVRADRSLLRQMLLNLARNAQQAMPAGGLLELQTRFGDGRVQLAIIDNGAGMDEATRSKLFHAIFSTKITGSGLGLSTVRKIVEAHQGSISCDSEPGRGTRFLISFPPAPA
ncbi:MAG TPA: ATP-binding protein [Planctomycetaceae bacterium]|jgi:signal transduction histidine kinase|nr:ATP-binding protein [Planctomycetaceae bacterium]